MDALAPVILASWDRQTKILMNLASLVDESNRHARPDESSWPIDEHLAHIHECRYGWLGTISKEHQAKLGDTYRKVDGKYVPIESLDEIRAQLILSGGAIHEAVAEHLAKGTTRIEPYDHPLFFLQHMLWHDGYHFGLIVLALRKAGQEPAEEWEERNVWGIWRDPEI